jgi:hypothetical protein
MIKSEFKYALNTLNKQKKVTTKTISVKSDITSNVNNHKINDKFLKKKLELKVKNEKLEKLENVNTTPNFLKKGTDSRMSNLEIHNAKDTQNKLDEREKINKENHSKSPRNHSKNKSIINSQNIRGHHKNISEIPVNFMTLRQLEFIEGNRENSKEKLKTQNIETVRPPIDLGKVSYRNFNSSKNLLQNIEMSKHNSSNTSSNNNINNSLIVNHFPLSRMNSQIKREIVRDNSLPKSKHSNEDICNICNTFGSREGNTLQLDKKIIENSQISKPQNNYSYLLSDENDIVKTIDILQSYIKIQEKSMQIMQDKMKLILAEKNKKIENLQNLNSAVIKENSRLKLSLLKVIYSVKCYEDLEIEREKNNQVFNF